MLNAFIAEIMSDVASSMLCTPSPTCLNMTAESEICVASSRLYPSRAKSAVAFTTSLMLTPRFFALSPASLRNLLYAPLVSSVTFFSSVMALSMSTTFWYTWRSPCWNALITWFASWLLMLTSNSFSSLTLSLSVSNPASWIYFFSSDQSLDIWLEFSCVNILLLIFSS